MTLKQRILEALDRLGPVSTSGAGQTLTIDLDEGRLSCQFVAIDQLGCAFDQFTVEAPQLASATLEQLDRVAAKLSSRLSYLLESISPVERDKDRCVVQMRSNPPHKDDDGTNYYELVVCQGELSLCRYSKSAGQPRRRIPAQVTREVFCRLAADFSAVAAQSS